ncbi:MAG TPA: ROK family protein [Kofleriaceae bacterium]|nr:ROK family protein [Kofleriaceae bacterium]
MEPARDTVLGVDIGGTKTALTLLDVASRHDVGQRRIATDREAGPDAVLVTIHQAAAELCAEAGRDLGALAAVGVAVPGLVDGHGHVHEAGKLSGWVDVPLRALLERTFEVPAFVEHDANAAALAEMWVGGAHGMSDFVFLALGTGVGAGIVIGGELHRGAHHGAGEIGDSIPSRWHLRGESSENNIGALIGGPAIRDAARAAVGEWLSVADTLQMAEEDDRLRALAERVTDYVALAIIQITAVLDPEAIFLGGGTAAAGRVLLDRVQARVEPELRILPGLHLSALGENAQLVGATQGALALVATAPH